MRVILITTLLISIATIAPAAETTFTAAIAKPTSATKSARAKKPDHWHARVKQIAAEIKALPAGTSNTVVLLGDSITERFKLNGDIQEMNGHRVINEGIGGDQIDRPKAKTGVVHRIPLVAKARPTAVFVMIGTNDFGTGKKSVDEVLPSYDHMLQLLRAALPSTRIVVVSTFPCRGRGDRGAKIRALNAKLPEYASQIHADYIDLVPQLVDSNGDLKEEYSIDGVHPKRPVYDLWVAAMKAELERPGTQIPAK